MTQTTSLILKFGTMSGEKTWTYKYANSSATTAQVKALMQAMITNGSIYKYPPLQANSAQVTTTTKDYIDIS